jgi:uncharacterized protein (DUF1800 family)
VQAHDRLDDRWCAWDSRMRARILVPIVCLLVAGVVGTPAASGRLSNGDLRWLTRVTFGIDRATVARYRQLGREKFLDDQLRPTVEDPDLATAIAAIPATQRTAEERVHALIAEQRRINALTGEDDKQQARNTLNQAGNQAVYETMKRHLMRALRSSSQLREQMTWFWMNHFSVFSGKANIRWTLAEYEERAVRAHALGRFSDLVLATATSPSMLEYLDNAQSAVGKINENYARELMELHTLGVSGGRSGSTYTQQDVQELARVLTGAGVNVTENTPRLPADRQALYVRRGLFEFNPARHDFGQKTLLGKPIAGTGFAEIEEAVVLLCRAPATARFISRKIATYFVADDPPPALVERLTQRFLDTDGDLKEMVKALLAAPESWAREQAKIKRPAEWIVAALRATGLSGDITRITGGMALLGQPLWRPPAPKGFSDDNAAWLDGLAQRLDIANTFAQRVGESQDAETVADMALGPLASAETRRAIAGAESKPQALTFLLMAPEFQRR